MSSLVKFISNPGNAAIVPGSLFQDGNMRACIGDSLTVNGISTQLANNFGWTLTTTAQGGNTISDQAPSSFLFSPASGDIYTMWLGTNDNFFIQTDGNKLAASKAAHLGMLLHLATKEGSNKVRAQSMSSTGTWTNLTKAIDASGRTSSTNGSTLSCTVAGPSVAVVAQWNGASTGTFTVTIDGTNKGTFTCKPPGGVQPSNIGNNFGPFGLVFTGLSNSSHSVVIAVTSTTGGTNNVYIDFVAGYSGTVNPTDPQVLVGNIYDLGPAGDIFNGITQVMVININNAISSNITTAQALGLRVSLVDTYSIVTPSDINPVDHLHLIQSGYLKVMNAFAAGVQ